MVKLGDIRTYWFTCSYIDRYGTLPPDRQESRSKKYCLIPILVEDTIFFIEKLSSYDYNYKVDITRYKKKETCFYQNRYQADHDTLSSKKFHEKYPIIEVQGILYSLSLRDGKIMAEPV